MSVGRMNKETGLCCDFLCRWGEKLDEVTLMPIPPETTREIYYCLNENEFLLLYQTLASALFLHGTGKLSDSMVLRPDTDSENPLVRAISVELESALGKECGELLERERAWRERVDTLVEMYKAGRCMDAAFEPDDELPDALTDIMKSMLGLEDRKPN